MSPIIGITVDATFETENDRTGGLLKLNWNYAAAVTEAGGVPILIPPMADMKAIASMIDGWLIPGGFDIDAKHFGEENHPKAELMPAARFEGEQRLMSHLSPEVPVLGICYGCQFLNVAKGGSLIQHLPDVVNHELHSGGTLETYVLEESKLLDAVGERIVEGKSYHHQAVGRLGENLKVVAKATDGTVEAIEATDRPWMIGVQWHPERTKDDPAMVRLFRDFIEAARRHAETRVLAVAP